MPPTVPLKDAVTNAINNAPGQRIAYSDLVEQLRSQGHRGFGALVMQMAWAGEFTATTEVEDGIGTLYFTPKSA